VSQMQESASQAELVSGGHLQRRRQQEQAARNRTVKGTGPAANARRVAVIAGLTLAGMVLRTFLVPSPLLIAVVIGALAAWAAAGVLAGPWARRQRAELARQAGRVADPAWVSEMNAHRQSLDGRLPAATLKVIDQYMAVLTAAGSTSAHVYVASRSGTGWLPMSVTVPDRDRVRIYLGEHVALAGPHVTGATLAHEVRHLRRWCRLGSAMTRIAGKYGWLILGWALSRPAVGPAMLALLIAIMLANWAIEISCDLGAAAAEGKHAIGAVFDLMTPAGGRRGRREWRWWALTVLGWTAGRTHPPVAARRLAVRILTRRTARPVTSPPSRTGLDADTPSAAPASAAYTSSWSCSVHPK
jgi:hypothetical protein